jgi:hypothetical protein
MASSDDMLIAEARIQTGYVSQRSLDDEAFRSALSIAKRHIRTRKVIEQEWAEDDWYDNQYREEALFWYACLFAKVATGELDAQDLQVGAVDAKSLLAKDNNSVTEWYRNAEKALKNVRPGENTEAGYGFGIRGAVREDRVYGEESDEVGDGTDVGGANL